MQPAILGQGFSRLLGVFPVSAHHPRPLGNYLAYLAQGQLFAVLVRYLYLHIIHRLANRTLQPLELLLFLLLGSGDNMVLRPQAGYSGGSLGLTEGIDEHDAREYVYRLLYHLEGHRGGVGPRRPLRRRTARRPSPTHPARSRDISNRTRWTFLHCRRWPFTLRTKRTCSSSTPPSA